MKRSSVLGKWMFIDLWIKLVDGLHGKRVVYEL